jgi:hypothetical protein
VLEAKVLIGATVLKATVRWKARSVNSLGPRCHEDFSCEVVGATVLGATVLAGTSCSWRSAEVCVTLGHEVGRRRQQRRELSVLYTTLKVSIYERRLFSFIAEGGFFMPGGANSVGLRRHCFFLLHLPKEVFYAIAINKYLFILKSK